MLLPAGCHADPFSMVGKPLPTSLEDGTPVEQIAGILGHQSVQSTGVYLNSRELHQAGEKPQVSWSVRAPNGFRSPMADAC
jgi:hypothetical protein